MRLLPVYFLGILPAIAQSYPPAPGNAGSTAISANSAVFTAWATGISVTRGPVNIADISYTAGGSNIATSGLPENALGVYNGYSVSLGDGGSAILTFDMPITNGEGFDFAVFENGAPDYLELAFVEASSDGVNFFRFPCHSQTQTDTQIDTFGTPRPQYLNNFAGKYSGEYGTPFDINDLPDTPLLDKSSITHIKVIDVVGSINTAYGTYDSYRNIVNDSFPTPFISSGFDLSGVGVIHQKALDIDKIEKLLFSVYPNPVTDALIINGKNNYTTSLYSIEGQLVFTENCNGNHKMDLTTLPAGLYLLQVESGTKSKTIKIVKK
nr:T9SS type A sorting domain-containing protein [uncultured Flavobacterium sp.]